MEIITGKTGRNHITSADDGQLHALMVGKGVFVLNSNANFSAELIDNNTLRIHSGDILMDGRHGRIRYGEYEDLAIDSGMEGYKRKDYIVVRYENNDGIESMTLNVEKGESTTGACPFYNVVDGDITKGATVKEFLMYEVYLDGTATPQIARFFEITEIQPAKKSIYDDELVNFGRKEGSAIGERSVALGKDVEASGFFSHAEGYNTVASEQSSHAEGSYTTASGLGSHAEGLSSKAIGEYSHAEGYCTTASGDNSHAEGNGTNAVGGYSHAEGGSTTASGLGSHAEGNNTKASEQSSHAEGSYTTASGLGSHAEGLSSKAIGEYSHAEGYCTIAAGQHQHAQGKWNVEDTENKYAHIVGGGDSSKRKNIHTLDWEGNAEYAGDVVAHDADGNKVSLVDSAISKTVTGKIVTLTDSADAPIISQTINGFTEQDGTATPDAPVEIVGMDKVSVKTCGKNLLEITANNMTAYGITLTVNEDKSITLNGTATQDFITKIGEFNNSNDSYFMSGCPSGGSTSSYYLVASCRDENNTWKADDLDVGSGKALSNGYAKRLIQIGIKSGKTVSNLTFYPMIRNADITDATYEPYKETVAEFDLADPLYEGDYVEYRSDGTGVLVRKMAKVVFDGSSDELWGVSLSTSTNTYYAYLNRSVSTLGIKKSCTDIYSTHYKATGRIEGVTNNIYSKDDGTLIVREERFATVDEYKTWLQANPVTVVYELETPIEIELTAEQLAQFKQLRTFEPITNILCDGETTTQYYKDNANGECVVGLQEKLEKAVKTLGFVDVVTGMNAWTKGGSTGSKILRSVAYGRDMFVAVGDAGNTYLSYDGSAWLTVENAGSSNLVSVAYGNYKFVAVGEGGAYYSENGGVTWKKSNGIDSTSLYAVTYGNGKFVTVGAGGKTFYSKDGVNWVAGSNAGSAFLVCVAYGNGKFVTATTSGDTYYSTDGITWTTGEWFSMITCVCFGNGRFVVAQKKNTNVYNTYTSTDGINWVASTNNMGYGLISIYCGDGVFVGVNSNYEMYSSYDGLTWNLIADSNDTAYAVAYGNGKFVTVGAGDTYCTKLQKETKSLKDVINELYSLLK